MIPNRDIDKNRKKEVHMEKYRFDRKLQEAVLRRKEGQQPAIIIDGKEMKVRNPVFVGNRTRDIPCLVEEDNKTGNTGYAVVAVSFGNVDKKDKEWICTSPVLLEQAIGFFIENHQMESMSGTCRCASRLADARDSGFDFETEDAEIEIKVLLIVPNTKEPSNCIWPGFRQAVKQMIGYCDSSYAKQKGKRIELLTICQHGTSHIQAMTNGSIKEELLKKAVSMGIEFWIAETKINPDGIELLSYCDITCNILND